MDKLRLRGLTDKGEQAQITGKDKIFTEWYYDARDKNRNVLIKMHRVDKPDEKAVIHIVGSEGTDTVCTIDDNHKITCKAIIPTHTMTHSWIDAEWGGKRLLKG